MHFMLKVLVKNCNNFWVVTTLPPLEKSCPQDLKKGEVREDIKEWFYRSKEYVWKGASLSIGGSSIRRYNGHDNSLDTRGRP
jgi:hypothetical protein